MANELVADASPEKRLFISLLTRDIPLLAAFLDLIDNSVNSAIEPYADRLSTADGYLEALQDKRIKPTVDIRIEFDGSHVRIADTASGIASATAESHVFKFGRGENETHSNDRLSVYGIGLKRAMFKLGDQINIKSEHRAGGFDLDLDVPAWARLEQPRWGFPISPLPSAKKSMTGTTISATRLHDDVSSRLTDGVFEAQLIGAISNTYAYFIQNFVRIYVNGTEVDGADLSMSENRATKELEIGEVSCLISAGLGPSDSSGRFRDKSSGWFVLCNGRAVIGADKTPLTGWGGNGLPLFQPKHRPFLGIIFFVSSDPEQLPWTTTKASINEDSIAWQRAKREMVATANSVIRFLDRRYTESGTEVDSDGIRDARGGNVNPMSAPSAGDRAFKPPTPKKDRTTRVQFDAKVADIKGVADHLRKPGMSGSEVGRYTLDFFLRNEVGGDE